MENTATASNGNTSESRPNKALEGFDKLPDSAFVRVDTVSALRNCSNATTWRHAKQGLIPPPIKLSPGITGWRVGDLRRALAEAAEESERAHLANMAELLRGGT